MSDLTLNDVKAKREAEVAEKNEAVRVERKNGLLEQLATTEARLVTYVKNLSERRDALKAQKATAKAFLDAIKDRADDEDLEVEGIETLLRTIDQSLVAGNNNFANGGHVGMITDHPFVITVNSNECEMPKAVQTAIREAIKAGREAHAHSRG